MAAASAEPESDLAPSACRHCPLWHLRRGARQGTSMKSEFHLNGCGPKTRTPGPDGREHPLVAVSGCRPHSACPSLPSLPSLPDVQAHQVLGTLVMLKSASSACFRARCHGFALAG